MTINKIPVQQSVVTNIVNFIFLYIAVLFVGTLLIAVDGKDLVTSLTAVLTCLGNVGPGFNG
ncbi:MAG: TrkH family potassium uptake protein, partial [[Eubacterium] sulci]|nr:TrkH family potassium uptake protein [[Eubacterium] sulci]